jgi:Pyruvate/2-oxoacid:ferredoxin oxidoreductase delta subunit
MPAFASEVQSALNEGVRLKTLLTPVAITELDGNEPGAGPLFSMALQKMKVTDMQIEGRPRVVPAGGNTDTLRVNHIFTAIGAEPAATWLQAAGSDHAGIRLSHCRLIESDIPMVYGGDLTNRTKSVSDAIASGKQAAIALDVLFKKGKDAIRTGVTGCQVGPGPSVSMAIYLGRERRERNPHIVSPGEINTHYFEAANRAIVPEASIEDRIQSFLPYESTLSEEAALAESRRCFNCGICNACDYCRLYCPDMSVVLEGEQRRINLDYCKGCGLCVAECPRNAMVLKEESL